MIVIPCKETKKSPSTAIRFALSSQRPMISTNVPIFDEFRN